MSLPAGARLGRYEILSGLGAGGMGEVYKARDTRLDRSVAIKILPEHLAADPEFRARFEREARAISQLTHPHICTLHDVGEDGGTAFLVMEYLEGETLAARLARGALPLADALSVATQIAAALVCAHRAGVVHRDLKPANVFLTRGLKAKLLDFGLARTGVAPVFGSAATGVTAPRDLTAAGTILGTVQYMTPEQLEGKPCDARTDIFAFGTVFYEMLTGRKAFAADSHAGVVAAILEREPPPLAPPGVPPAIRRIVDACLAKQPDDRWQSARDLLRELTWAADTRGAADEAARPKASRRLWLWMAAAAAGAVLAFAVGLRLARPAAPASAPVRFQIQTPMTDEPMSFALSPDGRSIVFAGVGEGVSKLFVRRLDDVRLKPLAGTDNAIFPFWSPDSRSIAFFAGGKLKTIDADGGSLRVLADAINGRGGAWNADGTIVYAPSTAGGLVRVAASGGAPSPVTQLRPGETSHRWPEFLPDGRRFFFKSVQGKKDVTGLFIGAIDGRETVRVIAGEVRSTYVPPDTLLLERADGVHAVHVDVDRATVAGGGPMIAEAVGSDATWARGAMSASAAGVIAYRTMLAVPRRLVWMDRSGTERGQLGEIDNDAPSNPEISPDGRQAIVHRISGSNTDLWLFDLSRAVRSRFTFDDSVDFYGAWTPDSRRIIYTSNRNGSYDFLDRDVDGAAERPLSADAPAAKLAMSVSPDGRVLLFAAQVAQTGVDIWTLDLAGDRKASPMLQTRFDEMSPEFSPNGRWFTYQSNESGQFEIYVRPFGRPGAAIQVSAGGGTQPRWGRDGKELFYVAPDSRLMAVPIAGADASALDVGTPKPLFSVHLATGLDIYPAVGTKPQYAVAPDGRFLVNVPIEGGTIPPITIAVGWNNGGRQ